MTHLLLTIMLYIITNEQSPSSAATILPTTRTPSSAPTFITLPFDVTSGPATITTFEMLVANQVVATVASDDMVYFDYVPSFGSSITIRMTFNWDATSSANLNCPYCIHQFTLGVENSHVNNACYSAGPHIVANGLTLSVSYTHDDTQRHISTGLHVTYSCDDVINSIPSNKIGFIWSITAAPTKASSFTPAQAPAFTPTQAPSFTPTQAPSFTPTQAPSFTPTQAPSFTPAQAPTSAPSIDTLNPSNSPTSDPTQEPTIYPSVYPSATPTITTLNPSISPTNVPTKAASSSAASDIIINELAMVMILVCGCLCFIILISFAAIYKLITKKKSLKQERKILEVIAERKNENRKKGENSVSLSLAGRDKKDVKVVKQEEEKEKEEEDIEKLYDHEGIKRVEVNTNTKQTSSTPSTTSQTTQCAHRATNHIGLTTVQMMQTVGSISEV